MSEAISVLTTEPQAVKTIAIDTVSCNAGRHDECMVETVSERVLFRCQCVCHEGKLFEESNGAE